jgi:oligopeptide/dipeptide ABC transporter ATP-binding protein
MEYAKYPDMANNQVKRMEKLLEINQLKISFHHAKESVYPVDNINFSIYKGETLCIVGESGSGKSITALSILRLLKTPPARYDQGKIIFEGEDVLKKTEKEMTKIRGREISMIFQEPMTALNPVYTIGRQLSETLHLHDRKKSKGEIWNDARKLLELVGIADPDRCLQEYPHELSGGMRQRVMIAIALSAKPKLLIADEPTTALDVTIQAQILLLLKKIKQELQTTILLITHDLGVVAQMADRVIVMYGGKILEEAPVKQFFKNPKHPYTNSLLACIPRVDGPRVRLEAIRGTVPTFYQRKPGCVFANRCPFTREVCREKTPKFVDVNGHKFACHFNFTFKGEKS